MKIVNLSLDPKALDPESVVALRLRAYGGIVEKYSVVVPTPATVKITLSDTTTANGVGGRNKFLKFWKIGAQVQRLIETGSCDVITVQDAYFLGLLGYFLAKKHHLGFEVQILGLEKLTPLREIIARFVLKRASVVRALSTRLKDRLQKEFQVREEKIVVVPIYVDVNKLGLNVRTLDDASQRAFEQLSADFKDTHGQHFNFLTVSRLVPNKRIEDQLSAVAALKDTHPEIRLHIVGAGPHESNLRDSAAHLGVSEQVLFHGYKTGFELGVLYIECDGFLLTSDYEGWGMVIIEAATAGLPIIMTDVGCAGELIKNRESGLVVPVADVAELTKAMETLVTQSDIRNALSEGATHALSELPTFDAVLQQYKDNWVRAMNNRL